MRGDEYVLVHPDGPHPVTGLDLVGVADRLAGHLARRGEQPDDLGPEPVPAGRGGPVLVAAVRRVSGSSGSPASMAASRSRASATSRSGGCTGSARTAAARSGGP